MFLASHLKFLCYIFTFDAHAGEDARRPVRALPDLHLLRAGAAAASAAVIKMDNEGPARGDALERRLRAEGTFGEWLDLEVGQGLANETRHGCFAFIRRRLE